MDEIAPRFSWVRTIWARWDVMLVPVLVALWLGGGLLTLLAMYNTDLRGDEYTYVAGARALADLLSGRSGDASSVADQLIGPGWFMPGLYVLGSPAFLLDPNPPLWIVRGWMGMVNAALSAAMAFALAGVVGRRCIAALLIFPGLAPLWHVAAMSFLPDLPAGILLCIAMTLAFRIGSRILAGDVAAWPIVLALQAALLSALFLRGPMLLPALAIALLLIVVAGAIQPANSQTIRRLAMGLALFAAVLGTWSSVVTRHFDTFVLTTTNVPLVLADSFGDPRQNCLGPCPPGADIWPAWHHAQTVAAVTGRNALAVQRDVLDRALSDLTPRSYLRRVRQHFSTFLLDPGGSLRAFLPVSYGIPPWYREPFGRLLTILTLLTYIPFMAGLVVANLAVFRHGDSQRLQAILLKIATACMFLQPFVHKASARYWVGLAPLAAWACILIARRWIFVSPPQSRASALPRWFDLAQWLYSAAFAGLTLMVLLA